MSRSPFNALMATGAIIGAILLLAPLFIPSLYQQIQAGMGMNFYLFATLVTLGFYLGVVSLIRFFTGW